MYYIIILVLLFLAELFYFRIADKCNIIDKPNERSSHTRITLRGGGIIFYFGVLTYFLTSHFEYPWFMLALTLITFISFVDDIRSTSQVLRLVFHFSAMALMFYQWGLFSLPWWTLLVALIVCTGIINAYNFMDGINGITGGYSLVVLVALAYINEAVVPFVEQGFILTVLCSVVVFNFFNFRKRAKCFAGDVGSVCIAFVLLFFIGKLVIRTEDFSWIIRQKMELVGIDNKLLNRSLNEGFSGGEKKKNEIFQMAVLEPKLAILDETDSGLDIDALRTVANGVNKLKKPENATIVITHYQRLLDYIVPDVVHVLYDGRIVKTAGKELVAELEEKGYDWIKEEVKGK